MKPKTVPEETETAVTSEVAASAEAWGVWLRSWGWGCRQNPKENGAGKMG